MEIHIARDNVRYGPYDAETLRELHANGQVVDTDLAWHQGLERWIYVAELDPSWLPRAEPVTAQAEPVGQPGRPVLVTGAAAATRALAHSHPQAAQSPAHSPAMMTAAQRAATLRLGAHPGAAAGKLTVTDALFGFTGRLSLGAYWGYTVALFGILVVVSVAVAIALGPTMASLVPNPAEPGADLEALGEVAQPTALGGAALGILIVFAVISLLVTFCGLALQVKRWHDRDKNGWWVLIGFIPLIGTVWVFVECYCLPGTPGPNRFGPDPRQFR